MLRSTTMQLIINHYWVQQFSCIPWLFSIMNCQALSRRVEWVTSLGQRNILTKSQDRPCTPMREMKGPVRTSTWTPIFLHLEKWFHARSLHCAYNQCFCPLVPHPASISCLPHSLPKMAEQTLDPVNLGGNRKVVPIPSKPSIEPGLTGTMRRTKCLEKLARFGRCTERTCQNG